MKIFKSISQRRVRRRELKEKEERQLEILRLYGPSICYEFGLVDPKIFEKGRKLGIKEQYKESK